MTTPGEQLSLQDWVQPAQSAIAIIPNPNHMAEINLGKALKAQAIDDLTLILSQGRTPPWWHDGPDLAKDVANVLTTIADDGCFLWSDNSTRVKQTTTCAFNLEKQANALALVRYLHHDLKYITVTTYDKQANAYRFGFSKLGKMVFDLWEINQE